MMPLISAERSDGCRAYAARSPQFGTKPEECLVALVEQRATPIVDRGFSALLPIIGEAHLLLLGDQLASAPKASGIWSQASVVVVAAGRVYCLTGHRRQVRPGRSYDRPWSRRPVPCTSLGRARRLSGGPSRRFRPPWPILRRVGR